MKQRVSGYLVGLMALTVLMSGCGLQAAQRMPDPAPVVKTAKAESTAGSWKHWIHWHKEASHANENAGPMKQPATPATVAETSLTDPQRQVYPSGAVVRTSKGDMVIELFADEAPITAGNFQRLVSQGFYDGGKMVFHRVVPGFVIQTGDPTGTGAGGSDRTIPLEVKENLSHTGKGIVAMARSTAPNSASSQFYITMAAQPSLDGKYAVFGRVIQGLDVIEQIQQGDRLEGVELVDTRSITPEAGVAPFDNLAFRMKRLVKPAKRTNIRAH